MYSLSDLVQALKMAEELSFWAGCLSTELDTE